MSIGDRVEWSKFCEEWEREGLEGNHKTQGLPSSIQLHFEYFPWRSADNPSTNAFKCGTTRMPWLLVEHIVEWSGEWENDEDFDFQAKDCGFGWKVNCLVFKILLQRVPMNYASKTCPNSNGSKRKWYCRSSLLNVLLELTSLAMQHLKQFINSQNGSRLGRGCNDRVTH